MPMVSRVLAVKGDGRQGDYTRAIHSQPVHYTCQRCGIPAWREQLPGPTPRYCDDCRPIAAREAATARQQKRRAARA